MRGAHSRNSPESIYLGLGAALFVASGGLLAGYFLVTSEHGVPAAQAAADPSSSDLGPVQAATRSFLSEPVTVQIGDAAVQVPWSRLGAELDREGLASAAAVARRSGNAAGEADIRSALVAAGAMPVTLDRARAIEELQALKAQHDRAPRDARMDLEQRKIHKDESGVSLDVFGSLAALELAARSGASTAALRTVPLTARVTTESLGIEDISHVLARFETKYAQGDQIRNFNLKLAASKLDGYVLKPGVEFSFNDVVGPRTENEGYKVAGVITAGEMVDGLAGGTCQISSTLHGAAFFAGLDLTRSLPHSRPSTYIEMGLDATVVYPQVDLKLRNSYDFPVAIRFRVAEGKAVAEILGKERPYDEIAFERKVLEKVEFETVTREDDTMPVGTMVIDQYGFYGYDLERVRKFYRNGEVVKKDKWRLKYQPVTEYMRTGTNPDPNLVPPTPPKAKKLREPNKDVFRITQ